MGCVFLACSLYCFCLLWFRNQASTASFQSVILRLGSKSYKDGPCIQTCKRFLNLSFDKEFLALVLILFIKETNRPTLAFDMGSINKSFMKSKADFHSWDLDESNILCHITLYLVFETCRYCSVYFIIALNCSEIVETSPLCPAFSRGDLKKL